MHHEIGIEWPNGKKELRKVDFIHYGQSNGLSAMAQTVGYPTAIATKMVLESKIKFLSLNNTIKINKNIKYCRGNSNTRYGHASYKGYLWANVESSQVIKLLMDWDFAFFLNFLVEYILNLLINKMFRSVIDWNFFKFWIIS